MPKFSAYMKGEGTKGDKGNPAGFGTISATVTDLLEYGNMPTASVTTSGEAENLNVAFSFEMVKGEPAGFSTNQQANLELTSVTSKPAVEVSTVADSPNNSKVFDFQFHVPEPKAIDRIEQTLSNTASEAENKFKIIYNDETTHEFSVYNGAQGEAALIRGILSSTTDIPNENNYIGEAYLVGGVDEDKSLWVYTKDKVWVNQGLINAAKVGEVTASATTLKPDQAATAEVVTSGPNDNKNLAFHFGVPQGLTGEKGDTPKIAVTTSLDILAQGVNPTVSVAATTKPEGMDESYEFSFGIPRSMPPEVEATATATKLEAEEEPSVSVIADSTGGPTKFNFSFGIPQGVIGKDGLSVVSVTTDATNTGKGNKYYFNVAYPDSPDTIQYTYEILSPEGPQGVAGYGYYQEQPFTSTSTCWSESTDTDGSTIYTLTIDRQAEAENYIPVSLYNAANNNIAATFTLTDTSIQYTTKEKFDGILYYIGKAPTPHFGVGQVNTVTSDQLPSITTRTEGYTTLLDFTFPIKGDTGNGIENITQLETEGLTTTYQVNFTQTSPFTYMVRDGRSIEKISEVTSTKLDSTYQILYDDGTTYNYIVPKGIGIDKIVETGSTKLQTDYQIQYINGETHNYSVPKGIGIDSIAVSTTSAESNIYTITYSNGTTTEIEFGHGPQGIQGIQGIQGEKGDKGDKGDQGIQGERGIGINTVGLNNISGTTRTYTITYDDSDTTSFTVCDGVAATISVSTGVIVDNSEGAVPKVNSSGTSTSTEITFVLPANMATLCFECGTTEFGATSTLEEGHFYFQYEEE